MNVKKCEKLLYLNTFKRKYNSLLIKKKKQANIVNIFCCCFSQSYVKKKKKTLSQTAIKSPSRQIFSTERDYTRYGMLLKWVATLLIWWGGMSVGTVTVAVPMLRNRHFGKTAPGNSDPFPSAPASRAITFVEIRREKKKRCRLLSFLTRKSDRSKF